MGVDAKDSPTLVNAFIHSKSAKGEAAAWSISRGFAGENKTESPAFSRVQIYYRFPVRCIWDPVSSFRNFDQAFRKGHLVYPALSKNSTFSKALDLDSRDKVTGISAFPCAALPMSRERVKREGKAKLQKRGGRALSKW